MLILHSWKFSFAVFILFVVSLAIFPKDSIGLKDLQKKRMTQEERLKKLEAENESLRKEMEGIKNNSIPVEAAKDTLKEPTKDTTKEIAKEKPAESSQVPETSTKSTVIKKYEIKSKGIKIEIEKLDEENQGKRYAILVGVNEYQDKAISKLSKARNDAKIFGKILKDMGQFDQVFVMTDDIDPRNDSENLFPSKLNIEEKLDSILRFTRPEDMIVFFFSGHGVSDMDENGYLIVVDTVVEKQFNTALSINSIVNRFKTHGIKKSLLILDACRDVLYASKSSSRNSILEKEFTGAELAGTFYSTKAGFYSYEDDETDNGVITKYLVMGSEGQADTNKDGVVAFSELEQFVQKGVKEWSLKKNKKQKPFTKIYGEKTGDLIITVAGDTSKSLVEKKIKEPSRLGFVWKSALIPGWGQWNSGNRLVGATYFALGLGFLGYYSMNLSHLKAAQSDYNKAIIPYQQPELLLAGYMNMQSKRNELHKAESTATGSYLLLLGFWIWNIGHAGLYTDLPKVDTFAFDYKMYKVSPIAVGASTETLHSVQWSWRF